MNLTLLQVLLKNLNKVDIATEHLRRGNHYFKFRPKQKEFADSIDIFNPKEITLTAIYGGAMGGGKSWVAIMLLIELAYLYPGSKWTIVRESLQRCKETVLQDFRIIGKGLYKRLYEAGQMGVFALFPNGSVIEFRGENRAKDPELDAYKSYPTNGFFFEQIEEISEEMYEMGVIRAGRHRIEPMPPQLIIGSINPTNTWARERFFEKWKRGILPSDCIYVPASIKDNPTLFEDKAYMSKFDNLDSATKARYLDGDWDAFKAKNAFAYAFNENKHCVETIEVNKAYPIYLSCDYNHSPCSLTIWQFYENKIRCLYELGSFNGLLDLCRQVKDLIGWDGNELKHIVYVTGDKSGYNHSELIEGNGFAYRIIQTELNLTAYQIVAPRTNPNVLKSRELTNSILEKYPDFLISRVHCPNLVFDMKFVECNDDNEIIKDRNKQAGKSDYLDTLRYFLNTYFSDFVKLS